MRTHLSGFPEPLLQEKLYNAWEEDLLSVLRESQSVIAIGILMIGHSPSVNEAIKYLCGEDHEFEPANLEF